MRTQKPFNAVLRYSVVLRFEPASFPPTADLSRRHVKTGYKIVRREYFGSTNLVRRMIEPHKLRTDGLHAAARAGSDGFDCCIPSQSPQQRGGLRCCPGFWLCHVGFPSLLSDRKSTRLNSSHR